MNEVFVDTSALYTLLVETDFGKISTLEQVLTQAGFLPKTGDSDRPVDGTQDF